MSRPASINDSDKSAHIRDTVLQAGVALRIRHPWLRHQDAIGVGVMLLALAGMAGSGWLYLRGDITWWLCVPLTAFCAAFIHELEHDLIHLMYFRQRTWANRLMLAVGWLARPNTVNPFIRKGVHLHHHKHSGQASDIEEIGITNGAPWSLRRLIGLTDNVLGVALRLKDVNQAGHLYLSMQTPVHALHAFALKYQRILAFTPVGWLYYPAIHTWAVWHVLQLLAPVVAPLLGLHWAPGAATQAFMQGLDAYAVVYLLPNTLRGFCLFFLSSNLHYYGDVEERNVMQQCQVLNAWWLLPMQLFCCNFGSTHAIHHFAVKEPFYIRQWTAGTAHRVMREMGVRFNDLGTFKRANRFGGPVRQAAEQRMAA
jgi:fatty acid desaturase